MTASEPPDRLHDGSAVLTSGPTASGFVPCGSLTMLFRVFLPGERRERFLRWPITNSPIHQLSMQPTSIIMLGATGAVGGEALKALLKGPHAEKVTLLGRRDIPGMPADRVAQHKVDIFAPASYAGLVDGHQAAICTLGVGQPSKISKEEFEKIDKKAVIDFAKACKAAGVQHFELLASVGIDPTSSTYYLRIKGELVDALKELDFERLSIFKPSMILTPTNRYGIAQGITLAVWPVLDKLFFGSARKYKGVKVEDLGGAMARNLFSKGSGYEDLTWDDFQDLKQT
jgi:uncharacterized protein YbjT (DUF2867 family)